MATAAKLSLVKDTHPCMQWIAATKAVVDSVVSNLGDKVMTMELDELSARLLKDGQRITATLLSSIIKTRIEEEQPQFHVCCDCNRTLKRHSTRKRSIETRHGSVEIERPYFYCKPCSRGYYPTDEKLGIISDQPNQFDLQKAATKLLQRLPYEEASELFEDLTGCKLSNHAMHDLGQKVGSSCEIADVLPTKKNVENTIIEAAKGKIWRPILVISADGAHVPVRPDTGTRKGKRGKGYWREAKGFRIYLICQDRIEQIMSWHQIANEEEFGEALRFAATLIPTNLVRVALIADGAKWIWNHLKAAFPTGKQILDYFHLSEHIHKAAELQYGKDGAHQKMWIETTMARLFYGDVVAVMWGLERMNPASEAAAEELRKLHGYLEENQGRIDYKKARRGQYPLGSGGIESANKFICHKRMKVPGAWWYEINGNAMLRLRCATYNGTFDEVFAKYKRMRLSGIKPSTER